jgi:WD40 repeat protein
LVSGGKDGTIRRWKGKPSPKQRAFHPLPPGVARGFASRNAGIGAAATSRGTIEVWDMPAARNLGSVTGQVAALTPDGQWLASGATGGVVTVFAVSNLQALTHLSTKRPVAVVEFDCEGAKLATVDHDSRAMVWKWKKQERSASWTISSACRSLAFSPDGQILALGLASGAIEFRNPNDAKGKLDRTLTGHNSEVLSVQFSPDGQWLLSGGADFTARIWDVRNGRQMALLKADRIGVFAVGFSPDGSRAITGAMDGTIRFWNFATGYQVLTLKGHRMQPALAFADGDRQLISISTDGIRYWRAPSWEEIAAADAGANEREAR